MRKILTFGFVLLLAGSFAAAAKGGGKGKPGGGDPGTTPPGTIVFQVGVSGYTAQPGDGHYSMDGDGASQSFLFAPYVDPNGYQPRPFRPSYATHGGQRWFLGSRIVNELLADNNYRMDLVARAEDGTELLLWSETGSRVRAPRWARDDSFLSFKIASPGAGTCEVVRAAVDWSSGEPEIDTSALETVVTGTYSLDYRLGSIGAHDWSPDGSKLVFTARDLSGHPNAFTAMITVLAVASGSETELRPGRHPAWSPNGNLIAFNNDAVGNPDTGGVYTMAPDGSGVSEVAVSGNAPVWSPDSAHVLFHADVTVGKGRKARTYQRVVRVPAGGGSETVLTGNVDSDARATGWRE